MSGSSSRWTLPRPTIVLLNKENIAAGERVFRGFHPIDTSATSYTSWPLAAHGAFYSRLKDLRDSIVPSRQDLDKTFRAWSTFLGNVETRANTHLPPPTDVDIADVQTLIIRTLTAHRQVDEKGVIGSTRYHKLAPLALQLAFRDMKFSEPKRLTNAAKRLLQWPLVKTLDRYSNSLYVACLAMVIKNLKEKHNTSLIEMDGYIRNRFGPSFILELVRNQDTSANIPGMVASEVIWTKNAFARMRAVRATPRVHTIYNKRTVTMIKESLMALREHTQDREVFRKTFARFSRMKAVQAKDFSGYDVSILGFPMTEQIKEYLFSLSPLLDQNDFDSMAFEDNLDSPFIANFRWWIALKKLWKDSGNSDTTIDGIMLARVLLTESFLFHYMHKRMDISLSELTDRPTFLKLVAKHSSTLVRAYNTEFGKEFDYLDWSDDCVVATNYYDSSDAFLEADLLYFATVGAKIDAEPTVKYLGKHYLPAQLKGIPKTGQSFGRFIIKRIAPERPKAYPFNMIGFVAACKETDSPSDAWSFVRSLFCTDAGQVEQLCPDHDLAKKALLHLIVPERYLTMTWAEAGTNDFMLGLMAEAMTHAEDVTSLDSILGSTLQGADLTEDLLASGLLDEQYGALIPALSLDITDPEPLVDRLARMPMGFTQYILTPEQLKTATRQQLALHLDASSIAAISRDEYKISVLIHHVLPAFQNVISLTKSSSPPSVIVDAFCRFTMELGVMHKLVKNSLFLTDAQALS